MHHISNTTAKVLLSLVFALSIVGAAIVGALTGNEVDNTTTQNVLLTIGGLLCLMFMVVSAVTYANLPDDLDSIQLVYPDEGLIP